jgi:hypothetical protein
MSSLADIVIDNARADERTTIVAMLVNAAKERERFICDGRVLKNIAGNDLFIDAARIDALIDAIRSRASVGGPSNG